ncbi:MAG: CHAT domain-containing protein [Oscillochloridaceae bacterium umkhey_bin13]
MSDVLLACMISQVSATSLRVTITREQPGTPPESSSLDLVWDVEQPINPTTTIEGNPVAYGQQLSQLLFQSALRERLLSLAERYADKTEGLRFQIRIDPKARALHAIYWETLTQPNDPNQPLFLSRRWRCSRHLSTEASQLRELSLPERPAIRALVAVANPPAAAVFHDAKSQIDSTQEVARARAALGNFSLEVLSSETGELATPSNLRRKLSAGFQILYLLCHGGIISDTPYVWLDADSEAQDYKPYPVTDFAADIRQLDRPPLLIVLVACHSGSASTAANPVHALGPLLAQAGVGAVVAMHGQVESTITTRFPSALFEALEQYQGDLELAMAEARHVLYTRYKQRQDQDELWWRPVLWSRLPWGRLWQAAQAQTDLLALLKARDFAGLLAAAQTGAATGWDTPSLQLYRAFGLLANTLPARASADQWSQVEAALLAAARSEAASTTIRATAWALLLLGRIDRYVLMKRSMPAPKVAELRAEVGRFAAHERQQELIAYFPTTPAARTWFERWTTP